MKQLITACIDGPNYSKSVVNYAIWAAQKIEAPLQLLHVLDKSDNKIQASELSGNIGFGDQETLVQSLSELDATRAKLAMQHSKLLMQSLKEQALNKGVESVAVHQEHGHFIETLLNLSPQIRLLVLGKSGEMHKTIAKAIGSQLESILRTVDTHVLIAGQVFYQPQRYLLAFDGSEQSQNVVEKVCNSPLLNLLPCHLVMVDASQQKQAQLLLAEQQLKQAGIDVVSQLLTDENINTALLNYQQQHNIDLLVMGAYGHSRLRQFFVGSTTTKLIAATNNPILIVK